LVHGNITQQTNAELYSTQQSTGNDGVIFSIESVCPV